MSDAKQNAVDQALTQAAKVKPDVPDDLMAAVLRDAARLQPGPAMAKAPQPGLWDALLDMIGGWPALSGVAAAGVAGVWIGVAPPAGLEALAYDTFGLTQTVDLLGADTLAGFAEEVDG